jgi:broad specificity polyphosphatase/5'/3'-nucleotidase SurE
MVNNKSKRRYPRVMTNGDVVGIKKTLKQYSNLLTEKKKIEERTLSSINHFMNHMSHTSHTLNMNVGGNNNKQKKSRKYIRNTQRKPNKKTKKRVMFNI